MLRRFCLIFLLFTTLSIGCSGTSVTITKPSTPDPTLPSPKAPDGSGSPKGPFSAQLLPYYVLSWNNPDTSTTMTINFQSQGDIKSPTVRYDSDSDVSDGRLDHKLAATTIKISGVANRNYHTVTLRGLNPDKIYYFQVTSGNAQASRRYHFQTLPRESHNISFIQGGDMGTSVDVTTLGNQGLDRGASVILLGGDLAYANGLTKNWQRWDRWLARMMKIMEPLDGRLIPMIAALGNHERNNRYEDSQWKKRAPFYFNIFNQDDKPYFYRKLGDAADVYILDSGFLTEHGGDQARWLHATMKARKKVDYRMAMYHAPLYPSHRSQHGPYSKAGRKHWGPIFDQFQLDVGFENHDHTMKRTYPLKNNKVNKSSGTVYVGDGCWGRDIREVALNRWYLKKAIESMHIWHVSIHKHELALMALDLRGNVLDSFTIPKRK